MKNTLDLTKLLRFVFNLGITKSSKFNTLTLNVFGLLAPIFLILIVDGWMMGEESFKYRLEELQSDISSVCRRSSKADS